MIQAWFEVQILPSGFQFYPEGSKVYYRLLTVREVQILARTQDPRDLIRIGLEGIRVEGFPKEEMILSDYYYVSLLRNLGSSVNERYNANLVCKSCGQSFEVSVEATDLEIPDIRPDLELSWEGYTLSFEPIRVSRFLEYLKIKSDFEYPFLPEFLASLRSYRDPEGQEHEVKMQKKHLESLLDLPAPLLEAFVEDIYPHVFPLLKLEATCSQCQALEKYSLPLDVKVIRPFRPA